MLVSDTRPAEQHAHHAGTPHAHAYSPDSRVPLCGRTRTEHAPQGHGRKCQACIAIAGHKAWVQR